MEAFSFLKYWKSAGAAARGTAASIPLGANAILAAVADDDNDDDGEHSDVAAAGDDGPFFDLEFAEPVDDDETPVGEVVCVDGGEAVEVVEEESETEDVVKFRVSSSGSGSETTDPKVSVSPSEDLFFRGQILPEQDGSDHPDPNSAKPQLIPVSLVRSATRLRVLMSGFKKSSRPDPTQTQSDPDPKQQRKRQLFTIKFRADEVPIISLFSRDHSSRAANGAVSSASSTSSSSSSKSEQQSSSSSADSDEKQSTKDGVQKYFKMVKPLYIRVSKRYGEKLGLSGQLTMDAASPSPGKPADEPPAAETEEAEVKKGTEKSSKQKMQGSLAVGLRVMMRKRLGKSKSAVAGVVHPAAPVAGIQQRDDSLIQQQEWIQGAILHCKRSFNASQDEESSVLSRSVSDPSQEMTVGEMISNA